MQRLASFLVLLAPMLVGGCLAVAAGAAGGAAASDDGDRENLEYWLKTNDTKTRIGQAMKEERLVEGMEPAEVKLVMGVKRGFEAFPTTRDTSGTGAVWTYEPSLDRVEGYRLQFDENRLVISIERTEPACENQIAGRGSGAGPCN